MFAMLQTAMIQAARGGKAGLHPLLMPAFLAVIFGTVGWHFAAVLRVARRQVATMKNERRNQTAGE
jgi:hypothetical protein